MSVTPAGERPAVEDQSTEDLRSEYIELREQMFSCVLSREEEEDLYPRTRDIWNELCRRSDVEQPECPECGARDWGQNLGDPIHCNECGKEGVLDDDLREEIENAWGQILGSGGDDA